MELTAMYGVVVLLAAVVGLMVWHAIEVRKYMRKVDQNTRATAIYLQNMDKNLAVGVTHARALALHYLPKAEIAEPAKKEPK